jgi:PAS domain S-box-containing protein
MLGDPGDVMRLILAVGLLGAALLAVRLLRLKHHRNAARHDHAVEAVLAGDECCRTILRTAMDGFWLVDVEGRFLDVNEAYCRLVGYRRDELLKMSIRDVKVAEAPQDIDNRLRAIVAKGSDRFESCHRTKDGRIIDVEVSANFDCHSKKLFCFVHDISDRRKAEQDLMNYAMAMEGANVVLEQFNSAAAAATRAKSEFLANVSHEIRTPMTAILGYTDILLDRAAANSPSREALEIIRRNGDHLLAIINNLLDISKIEAGKMIVELSPCSPADLIADVQSIMQSHADARRLTLRTECVGPVPETIQTDPARLRQILINIVSNAIKFTENGGVRLLASFVPGVNPTMRFDVVDTGIGMSHEQRALVFHPFTQGDGSTMRKFGGAGLGLTISKRLAEMLGGDVDIVESEPGVGTRCRVTVPAGPREATKAEDRSPDTESIAADAPQPAAAIASLDCRILLAEDGPDNQKLIAYILKQAGAEVVQVENGLLACEKALDAAGKGEAFDVVIMDMQMPVMDGYQATRTLRQRGYAGPIVALTAHALATDREKCLGAGCSDYVSKPIDRGQLLAVIASQMAGSNLVNGQRASSDESLPDEALLN